jgi:hypothetical protein
MGAPALQIETRVLEGTDLADTLVTFARQQKITAADQDVLDAVTIKAGEQFFSQQPRHPD